MATILLAILVMLLAVAAMAVGVMLGRKPIKGSCGGMSAMMGNPECPLCGGDVAKCEEVSSASPPGGQRGTPGQPVRVDPARRDS